MACFNVLHAILGSLLKGKQGIVDMSNVAEFHDRFSKNK